MAANHKKSESEDYQTLGDNVIPTRYSLNFKPNFRTFKYEGMALISVQIKKSTKEISLNAAELEIKSASVLSKSGELKASVKEDREKQRITIKLKSSVKGSASIKIKFTGTNNENMYGFYRSRYLHGKATKYILTSQFEAANARNAFPCFDEPSFKAIFDVSMTVDKDMDCISNMPVLSVKKIGKSIKEVRFKETPRMSTYLLYLGVGNYDYVKGKLGKIEIRVITMPGNRKLAQLPLEYAKKFIKFFEDYFGVKYPLPKVDFIAIPDFAAGAMENWGAITFRETALLAASDSSVATKQRIAEVIAHELVHQWFGDLVTMKWWNDLWLNESFATFMSYKALDALFPEWKMKIEYKREVIATAFGADQLKSTHPISVSVKSPGEIDQLFDEISYEKGGTVLNMIEHYSGYEIFREGLHNYLKDHSYSNATKFDLWRSIDDEAKRRSKKMNVYSVASFWVDKPGYPIIRAKRSDSGIELEQKRYFMLNKISDNTVWPIPINYSVSGSEHNMLFDKKSANIPLVADQWIKLNSGQNGLYRVVYDETDIEKLGHLIRDKKLSGADSWGIENDIYAMSRSGRVAAGSYLEFVDKYCFGGEYPMNANVLDHLGWISDMLYKEGNTMPKELIIRYSNEILDNLGWDRRERESTFNTMMRSAAIMKSGMAGHPTTIDSAKEIFNDYITHGKEIEINIRAAVFYLNAWVGDEKVFNTFRQRYIKEKVPEEKARFLRALAMFNDKRLLLNAFEFSMSQEVRPQDSFVIVAMGSSNPAGSELILEWTKKNWKQLKKRFASGTHMLSRYVDNLSCLKTKEDLDEVKAFFSKKENKRDDIAHALANTLEEIEANIQFMEANR